MPYLRLIELGTGRVIEARRPVVRLGRDPASTFVLSGDSARVASAHQAEFRHGVDGWRLADLESRNGTFLNGERVITDLPVKAGDQLAIGETGPLFKVDAVTEAVGRTVPEHPAILTPEGLGAGSPRTVAVVLGSALTRAKGERARGAHGATAFFKAVASQVGTDARRRARWLAAFGVLVLLGVGSAVFGVYWLLSGEVQRTEAEQQSAADSARGATERLHQEVAEARATAASASQMESLRTQLESTQAGTAELRTAFNRAQTALSEQLAAGEARRSAAQDEVQRLRDELATAVRRAPSQGLIDSLHRAVTLSELEATNLDAKMRAIRGTDFASVAQQSEGAVGLIAVKLGHAYYSGTGFVISPDGYMLTNWHVVADSGIPRADTIWVTMAGHSDTHLADVVATSAERDVALIKIRGYQGAYLTSIDWTGSKARIGEPALLIGFPAGSGFARAGSKSGIVRPSVTSGTISRLTDEMIQFDGMTIGGSSGSPLFNANGQVISIHRAALTAALGFAFSVPINQAVPLLPDALKHQLGVPQ